MKKIVQLIGKIDSGILNDIIYLHRLLRFYVRFMNDYTNVDLKWGKKDGNDVIIIKYFRVNSPEGFLFFTEREIRIDDIKEKIESIKKKVAYEFANRHTNKNIIREKDIHKWKKIIKDAEIQMSE